MKIYGYIAFDWRGASAETLAEASKAPAAIIDLRDEWVQVSRIDLGTMIVGWESVRGLRGWAPVPEEDR